MSEQSAGPAGAGRPRVAVVFGGRSNEHAISCVSAGSVLAALDPTSYDVVAIGIAPDGRWVLESGEAEPLAIGPAGELPVVDVDRPEVRLSQTSAGSSLTVSEPGQVPEELGAVDVVFPLLHGPWGEDGTVQGLLEMTGVRYVGAGVLASALGMDKHYMKVVLQSAGLPVLPHVLITPDGWVKDPEACRESVHALGFPVFVKPCRGGSSIGISRVADEADLDAAVDAARVHDPRVLVEAAASPGSREIECGVLASLEGPPEASVAAEIGVTGDHEFYDFEAKYLPGQSTTLAVPADLPEDKSEEIRRIAVRAFLALGIEGLARVDFFLAEGGRVVVNEVNTMPGFTTTSLFPRMWAASGVPYPELVDRLVRLALARGTGLR